MPCRFSERADCRNSGGTGSELSLRSISKEQRGSQVNGSDCLALVQKRVIHGKPQNLSFSSAHGGTEDAGNIGGQFAVFDTQS